MGKDQTNWFRFKRRDFREVKMYGYLAEKEDIRLRVTVEMQSGVITDIDTDT